MLAEEYYATLLRQTPLLGRTGLLKTAGRGIILTIVPAVGRTLLTRYLTSVCSESLQASLL